MGTKAEAESKLAELPLDRAVTVSDFTGDAKAMRRYSYPTNGINASVEIEIDADPSAEQLETLARNLPVPADKRAETIGKLKPAKIDGAALKRN
jgi:hypothetical protein